MADLYDDDVVTWSEEQAALLRRRAAGELVNDAELDWSNIAEEIEDVGISQRRAVEGHLIQALLHMLKIEAWPLSLAVPHWQAEIRGQLDDARASFTTGMRQRLEVSNLYRRALRRLPETMDGLAPLPVPPVCPVTLDDLLSPPADVPPP